MSVCGPYSSDTALNIALLNPSFHNVTRLVEVPLNFTSAVVTDEFGGSVTSDLVVNPYGVIDHNTVAEYNANKLYFKAEVPAMGIRNYKVNLGSTPASTFTPTKDFEIHSHDDKHTFMRHGDSWTLSHKNATIEMEPSLKYYISSTGNDLSSQASGAYIFRPNITTEEPLDWHRTGVSRFCGNVVC